MVNNFLSNFLTALSTLLAFFILMFVYTKVAGPLPFEVNSVTTSKSDAFSVIGEGKVDAVPDSATVRLGVLAKAATKEEAMTALNTNINEVIGVIKALGVEDKDIKTDNFNVYPEYGAVRTLPEISRPEDANKITGYTGNTNLTITVATADLANKIVDAGASAGANQIGGIDFQVKDKEVALNKAREMAVADAKKKAEDAARIAGFKLGKVINYAEGQGGGYPVPMMAKLDRAESAQGGETNVQPGTNEIMVTVTLSYEIR